MFVVAVAAPLTEMIELVCVILLCASPAASMLGYTCAVAGVMGTAQSVGYTASVLGSVTRM